MMILQGLCLLGCGQEIANTKPVLQTESMKFESKNLPGRECRKEMCYWKVGVSLALDGDQK